MDIGWRCTLRKATTVYEALLTRDWETRRIRCPGSNKSKYLLLTYVQNTLFVDRHTVEMYGRPPFAIR